MIKVLLFAHLKDLIGKDEIEVNADELTVEQLRQKLSDEYGLHGLEGVMAAVNEEFADPDTMVSNGDTVAFIPPVSGG
ncbi:molybdopterin converting factor subunit 1 [Peribacillus saganii]|uniref:Molybdopterin synthase sulfur carrier subunit n=1 Tax=Peribacillus saganii TaxID=2303992 RepID=A0A372LS38_9BACI|nr:molybdopterin converting factor subunit 1 [Peribacillus saganii]RFU70886.1 molybdopterin converting factor subunit 1 [Peribacillus saganii]